MSPQAFLLSFCYPGCMTQSGYLHGVVKKRTWMVCMEEENFQDSPKMRKQYQKTGQLCCPAQDTVTKTV